MTGSFLGLLAILMAMLAPAVSHSLAALHGGGESGMHCSMLSMQHAMHHRMDQGTQHDHPQAHAPMPDGDVCGYCSLLAHMPAVLVPQLAFTQLTQAVLHRSVTRFESVRLVEPLTPGQPRAPPVLLS
ncbi:conserved exported hypothetical protein [Paraburkholderia piptadeniae]|uniref:DUF2946 domain-containing protein n=1 Tax=Paraburkholderia piptadeniae TaxID=1701573 RepID=A0A1N7SW28_9BURK|nr:DUF2946 domain-containing protein [Paraburkholderia piptadeniae]SIT51678.1 conserved exported hypothetical protein [Paraburkholderia piptadeniae]